MQRIEWGRRHEWEFVKTARERGELQSLFARRTWLCVYFENSLGKLFSFSSKEELEWRSCVVGFTINRVSQRLLSLCCSGALPCLTLAAGGWHSFAPCCWLPAGLILILCCCSSSFRNYRPRSDNAASGSLHNSHSLQEFSAGEHTPKRRRMELTNWIFIIPSSLFWPLCFDTPSRRRVSEFLLLLLFAAEGIPATSE